MNKSPGYLCLFYFLRINKSIFFRDFLILRQFFSKPREFAAPSPGLLINFFGDENDVSRTTIIFIRYETAGRCEKSSFVFSR